MGVVGRHCLLVTGAVLVFAGEGGGEGVHVGDVTVKHRIQAVGLLVHEAVWDEDRELVRRVWVRAKQVNKIEVRDRGPLAFGAELGLSAVTQLGDCCSACTWAVLICFFWRCSYSFTSQGAWMWSTSSQMLSLSG